MMSLCCFSYVPTTPPQSPLLSLVFFVRHDPLSFTLYTLSLFLLQMSSLVSSILQVDDMPFIGSSKRKSLPTGTSSGGVGGTPRFAFQNHHSSAEYHVAHYGNPVPTPSSSWTSEMSMLADKIRDDDMTKTKQVIHLDRRSISQGLKLVSIAADEYDGGNETVALDIYLTGIDKILMALPSMYMQSINMYA